MCEVCHTPNDLVEGVQTKWEGFNILIVTGPKGFLAYAAIDIDTCQGHGVAAALVESTSPSVQHNEGGAGIAGVWILFMR